MAKALSKDDDKEKGQEQKGEGADQDKGEKEDVSSDDEVTMDDYLLALSVLDSSEAGQQEKEKAQKSKDKFESQ